MNSKKVQLILLVALFVVLFPPKAHAYLDPGTGSYVLQVVVGVFFAGAFILKTWWRQITGIFSKDKRKEKTSEKSKDHDK